MPPAREYKLSFCNILLREDSIAIIEINEGVDVDAGMAQELTELTKNVLGETPVALLSNRINSYSLSFEAMSAMAKLTNMVALAIVIYTDKSKMLLEVQNFFISHMKQKPVKIFTDKDTAIEWLRSELRKIPA